jgi:putative photosynthetic complex assembly protein
MSAVNHQPFPKGALIAMAVIVGFSVVSVSVVRLARTAAPPPPPVTVETAPEGAVRETIALRFQDEADRSVSVIDARTGARIDTLTHGGDGFVRGALRALTRERRLNDVLPAAGAFQLTRWADGRLTLDDTATGERIDLRAFGTTNEAAFARFLPSGQTRDAAEPAQP